jgi:hypothetical protein
MSVANTGSYRDQKSQKVKWCLECDGTINLDLCAYAMCAPIHLVRTYYLNSALQNACSELSLRRCI